MDIVKNRTLFSWVLQDVGNSAFATTIMAVLYPLYYQKMLGQGYDQGLVLSWWGYVTAISMFITALSAPLLGAFADRHSTRKALLMLSTAVGVGATVCMAFLDSGQWVLGVTLFAVGSLGFSLNNVFYDSFLPHLAPQGGAALSAAGYGLGYVGGGSLLVVNAMFVALWGVWGYKLSFMSVAVWWTAFTVPFFLFIKEPPASCGHSGGICSQPIRTLVSLWHNNRAVLLFLAAFWLYNDGLGTIMRMGVLYGSSLGLSEVTLLGALVATQFVGVPFTLFFGKIAGRVGDKKALMVGLFGYLLICFYIPFVSTPWQFWVMALSVGVVQGGTQALSRSLFASLVPPERSAELYGFYDMSSKFAGVLGPLIFGLLASATGSLRMGGPILSVFFICGIALLSRVKQPIKH